MLAFEASSSDPPIAPLIVSELIKSKHVVEIKWGEQTSFGQKDIPNLTNIDNLDLETPICTYLAKNAPEFNLMGKTMEDNLEVHSWLSFAIGPLRSDFSNSLEYLNNELSTVTFLVGHQVTLADIFVWSVLYRNEGWTDIRKKSNDFTNIKRWYSFMENERYVKEGLESVARKNQVVKDEVNLTANNSNRKQEGKDLELAEAEMGKGFPPEASE